MSPLPPLYPVCLVLEGRSCLVVGGGSVAVRKVQGLLACGALVDVVAPEGLPELSSTPGCTWFRRPYRSGEVEGYRLAIAASDDPEVNRRVFDEAEKAGVWVNSADQPDACSFTLPAVVRQGPVLLAVSSGGRSPALASRLAARLGSQIGPEHAELAEMLAEARRGMQGAGRSTMTADWQAVLDSDILDLLRAGQADRAEEVLRQCL